jgi:hypothetical protein
MLFEPAYSQDTSPELPAGNYVVVGAYRKGDEKFVSYLIDALKVKGLNPNAGFESERNFYYVYLDSYQNLNDALVKMQQTRQMPGLENAWVRVLKSGGVNAQPVVKQDSPPPSKVTVSPSKTEPAPVIPERKLKHQLLRKLLKQRTA